MDSVKLFCIVWCPQSHKPVTRQFTSAEQAITVADKLKAEYPDRDFHVMVSISEPVLTLIRKDMEANKDKDNG